MFEWFRIWFEENEKLLKQKAPKLEFSEKKVEDVIFHQSVDIISSSRLGSIIFYSIGNCDTHKGSLDPNEIVGMAQFIDSKEKLLKLLKYFFCKF